MVDTGRRRGFPLAGGVCDQEGKGRRKNNQGIGLAHAQHPVFDCPKQKKNPNSHTSGPM